MAKGKCINIGKPCDLAISEEVQDADPANFVCKECGKPLVAVDSAAAATSADEPAAKAAKAGGSKKGLIIGICVAAVAAIGGGAWLATSGSDDSTEVVEPAPAPEPVAEPAPEPVAEPIVEPVAEPEPVQAASAQQANPNYLNGYALAYGSYSGPATDGVPDGPGGTVKVTKAYQLDLKAGGEMLDLASGDEIVNCKFRNGKIVQGFLKRKNGEGRNFNIGI